MPSQSRFDFRLTGATRIAAVSLLLLLAFLASGCRQVGHLTAAPATQESAACGEGLLAAQAWKCLASRATQP